MALLRTNVLFPTDFEEAYNRLYAGTKPRYSGGASTGLYIPINEDKYRNEVLEEERKVAVKRSIAYPRSRLYPQVIARGGDIQSPEARKLIPKLLERRAEDFRKLAGQEVHRKEGVSFESPTKTLSIGIDKLLTLMLTEVSAGIFGKDVIEAGNEVLQLLMRDGNLLSKNQLKFLYRDVSDIYDNLYHSTSRYNSIRPNIREDDEQAFKVISSLVDTIGRTIRAIISRSELGNVERKVYQKSVKENATKFLKKNANIIGKLRQEIPLTPEEVKGREEMLFSRRGNFPNVTPFVPLRR